MDFDAVNYYVDPIPKKKLLDLLRKMKMSPRELMRTKEPVYKTLGSPNAICRTMRSSI